MSNDRRAAANMDSATVLDAVAPFVASFGFKIHDRDSPRMAFCSCFFLIINDHWVLCTAAHVMDDIIELQQKGIRLTDWHINDVFTKAAKDYVYPFDVSKRERFYIRDDALGLDYCLVYVESIAAISMNSRGLRAMGRAMIGDAEQAEKWVVTGFPSEFASFSGDSIHQRHYTIGVTPVSRPSNWDPDKNHHSLFGRLDTPNDEFAQIDIKGMSGGPVFGLFRQDNGTFNVRLVAVQSGWSKQSRTITACPIEAFLDAVDRLIADNRDNQA
ncbi:hypothetical protein hmeg3_07485 [Herbaspirillum sp. meg3]|uniref:hypothetical protein n=1 Tax=Herbaspirillum sp. meg3 TaxID=2025949 RepID=UPI000B99944E|nr:hypothetical protein [Herbaspirillum sp. meg3]ASU38158.1 hypothetical protein hmeg3_07485 [Herbaspirillum sp. meg3]